jgi:hypothetical protein
MLWLAAITDPLPRRSGAIAAGGIRRRTRASADPRVGGRAARTGFEFALRSVITAALSSATPSSVAYRQSPDVSVLALCGKAIAGEWLSQ